MRPETLPQGTTSVNKWKNETTNITINHSYPKLKSGTWSLTLVIYGAKVENLGYSPALSWGRSKATLTKTNNICEAPSGYNSAVLAPIFSGGTGEYTIRTKFVKGNTILIGFSQ